MRIVQYTDLAPDVSLFERDISPTVGRTVADQRGKNDGRVWCVGNPPETARKSEKNQKLTPPPMKLAPP